VTTGAGGRGTGGAGGAIGRDGGVGRDGGPIPDGGRRNPLLDLLPGIRSTPVCNACVDTRCNGTAACSNNPACTVGVACYFAACLNVPDQGQQFACATKCFNGNIGLVLTAFEAITCVYSSCGFACGR